MSTYLQSCCGSDPLLLYEYDLSKIGMISYINQNNSIMFTMQCNQAELTGEE